MLDTFRGFFKGKTVLVTGHTGFKGSWLCIWLHAMGAHVVGVALDANTPRDNYVLSHIGSRIEADLRADICDAAAMRSIFDKYQPEIVFHLAAQPLVRHSYEHPVETFETNVIGTVKVLEAIRHTPSVRVAVMITSDKCYENRGDGHAFVETDPMGGYDPYSASKGCCELVINSCRRSFFNPADYGTKHHVSLASARAGNVIGGGDWAKDRIIPDCIRAIEDGKNIEIRQPHAIRPWQHVLEPLYGYLLLAWRMSQHPVDYAEGWNFGPDASSVATVADITEMLIRDMQADVAIEVTGDNAYKEAAVLTLDTQKAKTRLGLYPRLTLQQSITLTADWYSRYRDCDVYNLCIDEISSYLATSQPK